MGLDPALISPRGSSPALDRSSKDANGHTQGEMDGEAAKQDTQHNSCPSAAGLDQVGFPESAMKS